MRRIFPGAFLFAIAAATGFAQPTPWFRTNGPYGGNIQCVIPGPGDTVFATAQISQGYARAYRSTDLGHTWSEIQNGGAFTFTGPMFRIRSGVLLCASTSMTVPQGMARSTDGGNSWTQIPSGFYPWGLCVDTSGDVWCCSVQSGLFRSTDAGQSWAPMNGDMIYTSFTSVTAGPTGTLYTAAWGYGPSVNGIYRSTDGGSHWIRVFSNSSKYVQALFTTPTGATLIGTLGDGVFRSSDGGSTWPAATTGLSNLLVQALTSDSAGDIYAGTRQGLFRSTDDGMTWNEADNGMVNRYVQALAATGNGELFSGTAMSVFRSDNAGSSWEESARGILSTVCTVIAANRSGTVITATGAGGGVYRTTDSGFTWLSAGAGLVDRTILSLASGNDGSFFAGVTADSNGIAVFRSTDQGASWTGLNTHMKNLPANALAAGPGNEVVVATTPGSDGHDVFRSTDNGTTWSALTTGWANFKFYAIAISPSDFMYAGTWGGLPVSTDGGATWNDRSIGLPYSPIVSLAADRQDNVFAATGSFGTYRFLSTHWELLDSGLPSIDEGGIVSLAIDSAGHVYGGSPSEGVYRLHSGGSVWQRYNTGLADSSVNAICIDPSGLLYAGTNGDGVYRNGGPPLSVSLSHFSATLSGTHTVRLDWTTLSEVNNYGFFVERSASPGSGFSALTSNVIPGHGTTAQPHDYSFMDTTADAAFPWYRLRQADLDGTTHYTGGVKAAPLAGLSHQALPKSIQLMQNYPNPFNPRTVIDYALPSPGEVTIGIYNVLGQHVATLFEGRAGAGLHEIRWDAARYPSGTYFYDLRSGGTHLVKRMILLK